MKKKVTANFEASWVLSHNGDAVLPVDKIINALESHYSDGFELIYKSFIDFEIVIDAPENANLKEEITVIILNETDVSENNSEFTVQVSEYTAQGYENVNQKKPEMPKKSWKTEVSDHIENKSAGTDDEWKTAVIKKMDGLVGCDDFKSLVEEYMTVAS